MIASTFLTALLAVGAVAARPKRWVKRDDTCLTMDQATHVAQTWAGLIANYSDSVALASIVEDFVDYSESVNSLINNCPQGAAAISRPLLDPSFTNRSSFMIGQSQQPPLTFNIQQVFRGCGSVSFRWMTNDTAPIPNPRPVVGIITIETRPNVEDPSSAYPFLIETVYSEFDSGDWLKNLEDAGICAKTSTPACTTPAATSTPAASSTPVSSPVVGPTGGSGSPSPTITPAPSTTATGTCETSTSTDADGNVWVIVTEIDDVYVTATDVVTVTTY